MESFATVVVGGGAAGICAAISQARCGGQVVICEKTPQLGKKILASGDGRCNLLNDDLSEIHYNAAARKLVRSVLDQFDKAALLSFFQDLGLRVYSREGRIFPVTNQASSVLTVLEMELRRLAVPVIYNFNCVSLNISRDRIMVNSADGRTIFCRKVVLTGGGKTYPAFGSDGSIYEVAKKLGHTLVEPVPAVVPLVVKDNLCQVLQGQRITAAARSLVRGREGEEARGELLFTKYGLSGTCILDVSESISTALNRDHLDEVGVSIDLVPFLERSRLKAEIEKRRRAKWPPEEMLAGLLPNKVSLALKDLWTKNDLESAVDALKARKFRVSGTRGWNEAEFTSGGIRTDEVFPETLESRLHRGVYFAGEVLDVNGRRGGYNLAWAWASGLAAGKATGEVPSLK